MRYQLLKLQKGKSTKAERIIGEMLKRNRIKFKTKVALFGREIDFLIKDKFVIEVGNHPQNSEKNKKLLETGYQLKQFTNKGIYERKNKIEQFLLNWIK